MSSICKMWNCKNDPVKHKQHKYYRFPKKPAIREEWIRRCVKREEDIPLFIVKDSWRVCSEHFPNGKQNADRSYNMPVCIEKLEEQWDWSQDQRARGRKNDLASRTVKKEDDSDNEFTPFHKEEMSVEENQPDEYCQLCMRVVATLILHKISHVLRRRLLAVFKLDFPVNCPGVYICTNCVNVMDITINFHRAVTKAHKYQSQIDQNFRLDSKEFWNNADDVKAISQCKDILRRHVKAVEAIVDPTPPSHLTKRPKKKCLNTIKIEHDYGAEANYNPEASFVKSEIVAEYVVTTMDQDEPEHTLAETHPSDPAEPTAPIDDNDSDDDFHWPYVPPATNILTIQRRKGVPPAPKGKPRKFKRIRRPVLCDICGKYCNRDTVTAHRNRHLGVKPYACEFCAATFYGHMHLQTHRMRMHISPRVRPCPVCGKQIRGDNFAYGEHMKTHEVERDRPRYACEICGRNYLSKNTLQKHKC